MAKKFLVVGALMSVAATAAWADNDWRSESGCAALPSQAELKAALVAATTAEMSGLNLQMWGTIVDRDGIVCAVAFTGVNRGAQWPGSRVISAQKANTANAFSLDGSSGTGNNSGKATGLALSTANLYSATQPGGTLFGLQASNPVNAEAAYAGNSAAYGTSADPMVGHKIGGVNVFGGGLALYDAKHKIVGAVGVSGDTSCADHFIAWQTRHNLAFDHMLAGGSLPGVAGVSGDSSRPDNIIFDITANVNGGTGVSVGGFGHPTCINNAMPSTLPMVIP